MWLRCSKRHDGLRHSRGHSHPYECKHLVKLIPRSWDSDFVKGSPILGETFCSFIYDNNNLGILVPIVDQDATKHYCILYFIAFIVLYVNFFIWLFTTRTCPCKI